MLRKTELSSFTCLLVWLFCDLVNDSYQCHLTPLHPLTGETLRGRVRVLLSFSHMLNRLHFKKYELPFKSFLFLVVLSGTAAIITII